VTKGPLRIAPFDSIITGKRSAFASSVDRRRRMFDSCVFAVLEAIITAWRPRSVGTGDLEMAVRVPPRNRRAHRPRRMKKAALGAPSPDLT